MARFDYTIVVILVLKALQAYLGNLMRTVPRRHCVNLSLDSRLPVDVVFKYIYQLASIYAFHPSAGTLPATRHQSHVQASFCCSILSEIAHFIITCLYANLGSRTSPLVLSLSDSQCTVPMRLVRAHVQRTCNLRIRLQS